VDPYENKTNTWNADVHLMTTYCFLSNEEARKFAAEDQVYLIKDVFEYNFQNITGSQKVKLMSNGMISNWMLFLQRNDVNLRNEWSNYTNWPYDMLPSNIIPAPYDLNEKYGPLVNPSPGIVNQDGQTEQVGESTGYFYTGGFQSDNRKSILETMGIVFDGGYRENTLTSGIYEYVEKYARSNGGNSDGLYCYNFCLNSGPSDQPSGAMNMNKFKNVQFEFTTITPPLDPLAQSLTICDPQTGEIVGINKPTWRIFDYNYNLYFMEDNETMTGI
jgi:hypothetical protein